MVPDNLNTQSRNIVVVRYGITYLIPFLGDRVPLDTIESVIKQEYGPYEIILLQNGVSEMAEDVFFNEYESDGGASFVDIPIKKLKIRRRGKSKALNLGIKEARYDFICVIDADCTLKSDAVDIAMKHFEDIYVSAVGGRLGVRSKRCNVLTFCQKIEYMKTFNIWRPFYNSLNANCLISGAYGIFRKSDIQLVDGYDADSVGEDMELVLSLQSILHGRENVVCYEKDSVCYTSVPSSMRRLLRQRDRWQRGLLDCVKKHWNLIFNLKYGALGLVTMPYQSICELFKPIFILLNFGNLLCVLFKVDRYFKIMRRIRRFGFIGKCINLIIPQSWYIYLTYLGFEVLLTCIAEYIEYGKAGVFITKLPEAVAATILGTVLSVPLAAARFWGMITFHWRKTKW